ncbi:MAG: hypothetical protein ACM3QX_17720, partial [Syntrophomonadaceae bacterium]
MKKFILAALTLLVPLFTFAQNKADFDFNMDEPVKGHALFSTMNTSNLEHKDSLVSYTLLKGGYFTLGTNRGVSSNSLDDQCQITFGHPYAMTSYPVFSLDGQWYRFDDLFTNTGDFELTAKGDTLKISALKTGVLSVKFSLYFQKSDSTFRITEEAVNLDSNSHKFGLGFVLDPALGRLGDAAVYLLQEFLKESKILSLQDLPSEILLWEKSTGAKGLSAALSFGNKPDKMIIANWADLEKSPSPEFDNAVPKTLYDCVIKSYWDEAVLNPYEKKSAQMILALRKPDFSSVSFLRWDMPQFISLENGLLFPQNLDTYLEIKKTGTAAISNGSLKVNLPSELTSSKTDYSYGSVVPVYQNLEVSPRIIYEDKIAEISVSLFDGTNLVDEIHRSVFIPATPVSDSGLVVKVDTLISSKFPNMSLTFEVKRQDKGSKITTLTTENIFLYENSSRLTNFT